MKRTAEGSTPARAAIYVRVSTEDQATNGVSLDMQEQRLREYCKARGWQVAGVYRDEGASAKNLDRPALRKMLEDAKAGKLSVICVFKLDRLTRSLRDFLSLADALQKRGIALASLSENLDLSTEAGRMLARILAVFAEHEREVIGSRISAAMRHKRENLESYGPPPFGFSKAKDGRLVPDGKELAVMRWVHRARRKNVPLRTIAAKLNARGVPAKRNGKWHVSTVVYLLKNDLYAPYLKAR